MSTINGGNDRGKNLFYMPADDPVFISLAMDAKNNPALFLRPLYHFAIRVLEEKLEDEPFVMASDLKRLGILCREAGYLEKSLEYLEKAASEEPCRDIYYELANTCKDGGRFSLAVDYLDKIGGERDTAVCELYDYCRKQM